MAIDPIGLLDGVEGCPMGGKNFAALGDPRFAHQRIEIVPKRLGEFRLGVEQIHDAQVRLETRRVGFEGLPRDPALGRQRPQAFQAFLEACGR